MCTVYPCQVILGWTKTAGLISKLLPSTHSHMQIDTHTHTHTHTQSQSYRRDAISAVECFVRQNQVISTLCVCLRKCKQYVHSKDMWRKCFIQQFVFMHKLCVVQCKTFKLHKWKSMSKSHIECSKQHKPDQASVWWDHPLTLGTLPSCFRPLAGELLQASCRNCYVLWISARLHYFFLFM